MRRVDFQCEVLTPLFLAGADPRGRPELRASAIRGAMRYWYRALVGGSTLITGENAECIIQQLKRLESHVFGDTTIASRVIVLVHEYQSFQIKTFQKDRAIRTPEGYYLPTGKDYLLWSMAGSGRPGTLQYRPAREYIYPGAKFTISLCSREPQHSESLEKAIAALWLLSHLGALGARARRGAGSIVIKPEDPSKVPIFFRDCSTLDELQIYLSDGIRQCLALVGGSSVWRTSSGPSEYDILSPEFAKVWVVSDSLGGWETAFDALERIGSKLRDYRSHHSIVGIGRDDHDAVLEWLESGGQPPMLRRTVFGLPLPFRYSEGGPSDVIVGKRVKRRASPLHIRVTRLATGRYAGVLVLFKSQFLESGESLQLQTRKRELPPPKDYKTIEQFIEKFGIVREVSL